MEAIQKTTLSLGKIPSEVFSTAQAPILFKLLDRVINQSINRRQERVLTAQYGRNEVSVFPRSRKRGGRDLQMGGDGSDTPEMEKEKVTVLVPGFKHLNFALTGVPIQPGQEFQSGKDNFTLHDGVEDETHANSLIDASDYTMFSDSLSRHASPTIGYAINEKGKLVTVDKTTGRVLKRYPFTSYAEKLDASQKTAARVREINEDNMVCGSLSPEAVELSEGGVKVRNPSRLKAMLETDSPFHDIAATIALFAKEGLVKKEDIRKMAGEYLCSSCVARTIVYSYSRKKGIPLRSDRDTVKNLADAAEKMFLLF